MINGAVAEQAGAAFGMFANHARERAGGTGGGIVGGAENGDGRDGEGGGHMHGAGIVGQKKAAGGGEVDEFAERGLAGYVAGVNVAADEGSGDLFTERALGGGAEDQDGIL